MPLRRIRGGSRAGVSACLPQPLGTEPVNDAVPGPRPRTPIVKRAYRFIGRMNVAAALIAIVLVLAALGSLFPQLPPAVAADAERLARWQATVREKYGALAGWLATSGAWRWFRSPVFLAPLALLAVATLACTLDRWRGLWRRAFHQPVRCSDVALASAPHTASLSAPPEADWPHVVCQGLARRGFRVRCETADGVVHLRGDRHRLTPLATLVTHVALLLLLLGAALSSGYGWREEITIGPGETAGIGHGSGLAVRHLAFAVERYPDGSVAGYEARVALVEGGREARRGRIRLNEPLVYGPVGLYLRSYAGTEGRYSVTLLAVHDPGCGPVIVAGFLLLLGMTVSFNFPHCCVRARIEPGGRVCLAGRADRRACDFGREFAALVDEIERAVESP